MFSQVGFKFWHDRHPVIILVLDILNVLLYFFAFPRWLNMPSGSVKLQSIKKLGQENHSYEFSDEGNALLCLIF